MKCNWTSFIILTPIFKQCKTNHYTTIAQQNCKSTHPLQQQCYSSPNPWRPNLSYPACWRCIIFQTMWRPPAAGSFQEGRHELRRYSWAHPLSPSLQYCPITHLHSLWDHDSPGVSSYDFLLATHNAIVLRSITPFMFISISLVMMVNEYLRK